MSVGDSQVMRAGDKTRVTAGQEDISGYDLNKYLYLLRYTYNDFMNQITLSLSLC